MMKTFKQFLKAKTVKVPVADYYPSHGSHAQQEKKVPVADYYPSHGKHSMKEEAQNTIGLREFEQNNPNSKIDSSVHGVNQKLGSSEEEWEKKLKPHEIEAVSKYTGSSHGSNKELIDTGNGRPSNFEHKENDDKWTKDWKNDHRKSHEKLVSGLDSILNRSRVPRNITVMHGINAVSSENFNPGEVASQHPERHIRMPAYLSTTVDPSVATSFAKPIKWEGDIKKPTTTHILRIHLKRGQKGYRYVGDRSSIAGEHEGILGRGKLLKIGEHPTIIDHPTGGQIHVWDAHMVDEH
jgi:hypothetical protein